MLCNVAAQVQHCKALHTNCIPTGSPHNPECGHVGALVDAGLPQPALPLNQQPFVQSDAVTAAESECSNGHVAMGNGHVGEMCVWLRANRAVACSLPHQRTARL